VNIVQDAPHGEMSIDELEKAYELKYGKTIEHKGYVLPDIITWWNTFTCILLLKRRQTWTIQLLSHYFEETRADRLNQETRS
jgi:hypothetical protein